jgi:hypothetical protein
MEKVWLNVPLQKTGKVHRLGVYTAVKFSPSEQKYENRQRTLSPLEEILNELLNEIVNY